MRIFLYLFCFIFFGNVLFYFSPGPNIKYIKQTDLSSHVELPTQSNQPELSKNFSYRGPLDDCLIYQSIYDRSKNNISDCTLNYVHYYPTETRKFEKNQKRPKNKLKIGSFNLLHLGDNQAPMKSFSVLAAIINQWDIAGAQEMMPLGLNTAEDNQKLNDLVLKSTSIKSPVENWTVITPGYLLVLSELQKLDSSWALILQSTSEGEGGSGEMAGFFYRSSTVQLKEWDYCPFDKAVNIQNNIQGLNLGCLSQVSADVRKLTSRLAFAAYFQSGNFDFIGLTTHNRFRPSMLPKEIAAQKDAICNQHSQPKKCKISKDQIGRYYEIYAVAQQISEMKEKAHDADVIFTGDFNLELTQKSLDIWKAALRPALGLKPFQKEATTVGIKFSKMISNYDHFIFDEKLTTECEPNSVKAYDFLKAAKNDADEVGQVIHQYFDENKRIQLAEEKKKDTDSLVKIDKSGSGYIIRKLTEIEKEEAFGNLDISLERMKFNEYALVQQLISDHIPIEMSCRTDLQDDD